MMLTCNAFMTYGGVQACEAIGSGVKVFEFLLQSQSNVVKIWVNANTGSGAIDYFERRFNLRVNKITTLKKTVDNIGKRLYCRGKTGGACQFEDIIMRRVY